MLCDETYAESELAAETGAHQQRILIVDDDQSQADVLAHRFAGQGYRTSIAGSGRHGLQLARCEAPNLIVLDLRLPDLHGLNVCRELSDDSATCNIPVIVLTGMVRPDIVRRARAAGCQFYVRKPYDPNALLLLAQNAIAESGL